MGIIDRIILTIYTFLLSFLALGVILVALNLIPLELIWTGLNQIKGRWEAALVGFVFFLVSVRLLLAGLRSRRSKETIAHHTEMGNVHISLDAVKNLVEKTARHTRGVRGVKVSVAQEGQGLKVFIKAVVSPESNVPAVGNEMQQRVQEYIRNTVGIEAVDIHVLVENISNDFKTKQRVE
ncbi:MAG: alkaline shock response membrane anchor protein AmaP [Negativicutes bacterium]|nr:alkaline shock response membrane anchor protein AmaP [Negativicutes bacterium]